MSTGNGLAPPLPNIGAMQDALQIVKLLLDAAPLVVSQKERPMDADTYGGWRRALNGGPLELSAGRFRHKRSRQPVAIYPEDVEQALVYQIGQEYPRPVDERWEENFFSYCEPVSAEAYEQALRTGVWWDHQRIGDNRPPEGVEALREEIAQLRDKANELIKAGAAASEETANAAANLRARLDDARLKFREHFDLETAPINAEINRIEEQKRPWREKLSALADTFAGPLNDSQQVAKALLKVVIEPFLVAKRREQEKAGQVQNLRGGGIKPAPTNVGATGGKVKLVTRWSAVVEDWDAAIMALKENPKLRASVQDIADAAARSSAKLAIPGVRFEKREVAQ